MRESIEQGPLRIQSFERKTYRIGNHISLRSLFFTSYITFLYSDQNIVCFLTILQEIKKVFPLLLVWALPDKLG